MQAFGKLRLRDFEMPGSLEYICKFVLKTTNSFLVSAELKERYLLRISEEQRNGKIELVSITLLNKIKY